METIFYIARHGKTNSNKLGIVQGAKINDPLNEEGIRQAQDLKKTLQPIRFNAMYSSHLLRASQTAEIVNNEKGLKVIEDKRLGERDFGRMEGLPFEETKEARKDFFRDQSNNPYGIETDDKLEARVIPLLKEIAQGYLGANVLILSHSSVMRFLINYFNFIKYEDLPPGGITNCSYIKVVFNREKSEFKIVETYGIDTGSN